MPSYSVKTLQTRFPGHCAVTGRDMYEIEVAEMLPNGSWKDTSKHNALMCPFVENIKMKYKGNDFTITIPFKFIPDNTDASGDVVEMLRNRTDIYCMVCRDHIWIASC